MRVNFRHARARSAARARSNLTATHLHARDTDTTPVAHLTSTHSIVHLHHSRIAEGELFFSPATAMPPAGATGASEPLPIAVPGVSDNKQAGHACKGEEDDRKRGRRAVSAISLARAAFSSPPDRTCG